MAFCLTSRKVQQRNSLTSTAHIVRLPPKPKCSVWPKFGFGCEVVILPSMDMQFGTFITYGVLKLHEFLSSGLGASRTPLLGLSVCQKMSKIVKKESV